MIRIWHFHCVAWVQSLSEELRSHKPRGTASLAENILDIEMLPDINAALATVQIKEFARNETRRKELYALYNRSVMSGKNKGFARDIELNSTIWSFPLSLNSKRLLPCDSMRFRERSGLFSLPPTM